MVYAISIDSGDNLIHAIKVKKAKATLNDHKGNIVDFILPQNVKNEIFSLDDTNMCIRWLYQFKDIMQKIVYSEIKFPVPVNRIE